MTDPATTPQLNEGSLPEKAIGKILNTQPVASIEFSAAGGVKITMVSAPEHVMNHTPIVGIDVPANAHVDPKRLRLQLDALAKEGLLGPAARELAERTKEAVAKGPTAPDAPVRLPEQVTLAAAPLPQQQVASTPTALAPASEIVVDDKAVSSGPVTPSATPAPRDWAARIAGEKAEPQVRQL